MVAWWYSFCPFSFNLLCHFIWSGFLEDSIWLNLCKIYVFWQSVVQLVCLDDFTLIIGMLELSSTILFVLFVSLFCSFSSFLFSVHLDFFRILISWGFGCFLCIAPLLVILGIKIHMLYLIYLKLSFHVESRNLPPYRCVYFLLFVLYVSYCIYRCWEPYQCYNFFFQLSNIL